MNQTKESIICDACQKELIEDSPYPHRYGLKLSVADYMRHSGGGFRYGIMQHPPLSRDHHFCGVKCLIEWAEATRIERASQRQAQDKSIESDVEYGTEGL